MEFFNWRGLIDVVWKIASVFLILLAILVATNWNNFKLLIKVCNQMSNMEKIYETGVSELDSARTLDEITAIERSMHLKEKSIGERFALSLAGINRNNDNQYTDLFLDVMSPFLDPQKSMQDLFAAKNLYFKVLANKKRSLKTVSKTESNIVEVHILSSTPVLDDVIISGRAFSFKAENLVDGSLATSWQPKTAINGSFVIGMKETAKYELSIINGFADTCDQLGDLYRKNNRVRALKIEYGTNLAMSVHVNCADDVRSFQKLGVFETGQIRVTVVGVYPGEAWNDTAISEIQVCKKE